MSLWSKHPNSLEMMIVVSFSSMEEEEEISLCLNRKEHELRRGGGKMTFFSTGKVALDEKIVNLKWVFSVGIGRRDSCGQKGILFKDQQLQI